MHLTTIHKEEEDVKKLLEMPNPKERAKAIAALRKKGILKYNQTLLAKSEDTEKFISQRSCDGAKVICSTCSGTFKKAYFYKHQKICSSPKHHAKPLPLCYTANPNPSKDQWVIVLQSMMKKDQSYNHAIRSFNTVCWKAHI